MEFKHFLVHLKGVVVLRINFKIHMKFRKILTLSITLLLLSLSFVKSPIITNAQEYNPDIMDAKDFLTVIDESTGKEIEIKINNFTSNVVEVSPLKNMTLFSNPTEKSYVKDAFIEFEIPIAETANVSDTIDTSRTYGDFYAYLKVSFTEGGTSSNPTIKVTNVSGYWSYSGPGGYRFENREVIAKQGNWLSFEYSLYEVPSSYNFSYSTGWGFTEKYPVTDYSGVLAMSSAKPVIDGMGTTGYVMETKITY